jgi:hypothetical protein
MPHSHKTKCIRVHQKSQVLRMLLTSGVVRSATVGPPCMARQSQLDSLYSEPLDQPEYTRSPRTGLLPHWRDFWIDIVNIFGRK